MSFAVDTEPSAVDNKCIEPFFCYCVREGGDEPVKNEILACLADGPGSVAMGSSLHRLNHLAGIM